MATTQSLGIVSPVPRGEWDSATAYNKLNIVSLGNAVYMAKQASTGVRPGVSSDWQSYWALLISSSANALSQTRTVAVTDWQLVSGDTYSVSWSFTGLTDADLVFVSPQNDEMFTEYDLQITQNGSSVTLTALLPATTQTFDIGIVKATAL